MKNQFKNLTPEQFQIFFDTYKSLSTAITNAGGNPAVVLNDDVVDKIVSWTQNGISITARYVGKN